MGYTVFLKELLRNLPLVPLLENAFCWEVSLGIGWYNGTPATHNSGRTNTERALRRFLSD